MVEWFNWAFFTNHFICIVDLLALFYMLQNVWCKIFPRRQKYWHIYFYCILCLMVTVVWTSLGHPYTWLQWESWIKQFWTNGSTQRKHRTSCYMEVIVCICVLRILKYLSNILVYKLLLFTVFTLSLHLDEFMRGYPTTTKWEFFVTG